MKINIGKIIKYWTVLMVLIGILIVVSMQFGPVDPIAIIVLACLNVGMLMFGIGDLIETVHKIADNTNIKKDDEA